MRCLLSGLLVLMAAVTLLTAGCENVARAPEERSPDDAEPADDNADVAAVVVTAERPAWLMPEVVARASLLPEVAAHASRATSDFVN